MVGTGYVGLVSGACFSEFGFEVVCVDKDEAKIERLKQGIIPIYEPGLEDMVKRNSKSERLLFSTNLRESVKQADAVFIAVGTPSRRGDGHADLTYVYAAAEEIAESLKDYSVVVTKSTVPVGTGRKVRQIITERNPKINFDVASNPEFLREGSAIDDFMRPDRVLVGAESERAIEVMKKIYRPLYLNETPVLITDIETAELTKYAANCFLATKVAFINQMADICEKVGANVQDLARAIGLDKRIGNKFLNVGPGYGGSCFPKDTLAMEKIAESAGAPSSIVNAVVKSNTLRKERMADIIIDACNGTVKSKIITVLGLTFKPNTDDVRESPSIDIIEKLVARGAYVKTYDPKGMEEFQKVVGDRIEYCESAFDAMFESEALVIVTEWNEFRSLDLTKVKSLMKKHIIVDLRNIYNPAEMRESGFTYISLGRE